MNEKLMSIAIMALIILGSFGAFGIYSTGDDVIQNLEYKPGEVIVGFHTGSISADSIDVRDIESFEGHNIKEKIEVLNAAVIDVNVGQEQIVTDRLIESPFVKYAEPNYAVHVFHIPDDPQ